MSDVGEHFNALKKHRKEKRAQNRKWSTQYLIDQGFTFRERNNGAHLIVTLYSPITGKDEPAADFWPGTGKYKLRNSGEYKRGVKNLIEDLENYTE